MQRFDLATDNTNQAKEDISECYSEGSQQNLKVKVDKVGSFFRFFVMQKRPWHGIMLASWMSHDVTEASTETGPKPATFLLLWAEEAVKRLVQARDVTPTYIPTCCTCQLTNFSVFFLATLA